MLRYIHIKDLAVIENLALDLKPGMTVLSGETGAGKSILIDALALALGDRFDSGFIREGSLQAEVSVQFDVASTSEAVRWLQDQALHQEGECILRRVLPYKGRSRGFINGRPAPIQSLRELGNLLVDIHGQHAHQSLLHRDYQRELLDGYGDHNEILTTLEAIWLRWKKASDDLRWQQVRSEQAEAHKELLKYQIRELQALQPEPDEYLALSAEQKQLAHAAALLATCHRVLGALSERERDSVQAMLGQCISNLTTQVNIDCRLQISLDLLNSALIQTEEAIAELQTYHETVVLDPERKTQVEERLHSILSLAAKHHVPPEDLAAHLQQLLKQMASLEHIDEDTRVLEQEIRQLRLDFQKLALDLRSRRKIVAKKLAARTTTTMRKLGIPQGHFEIQCHPRKEGTMAPHGMDQINFMVCANPGQSVRALSKVASGGELSRISLALQVETVRIGGIPTLIFDEVDVGIGGGVAEVVGRQLRVLGEQRQVLCITHLPQVAAQSHHHYKVSKRSRAGVTRTSLRGLVDEPRVREVARMLGGLKITEQSLAHAKEMLDAVVTF